MSPDRIAKLCLGSFPGFGSRTLRALWRTFPSPQAAWSASSSQLMRAGISQKVVDRFVAWRKEGKIENLLDLLQTQKITVFFAEDDAYPENFRHSSDPPEILFVRGCLSQALAVSVVGTRSYTAYGKRCVDLIVPDLSRTGLTIVSGLALGIDAFAHQATLEASGSTIAVLGGGVDDDWIYPRENYRLAMQILKAGGAILSEFPPGAESRKEHFPMRNRLIASLSNATLVIEGAQESGSMITAKLALEEGREVLAVPGPIWSRVSGGTNHLLKLGAKPCTSAQDVLEALAFDQPELIAQARTLLPLDPAERELLDSLSEPRHVDELTRISGKSPATIASQLALLEVKGLVKSIGGQMWVQGSVSRHSLASSQKKML